MAAGRARKQGGGNGIRHLCRDCENSYDWHEKSVKGEFFMCRCPHHRFSRFLNHDGCDEHFKPRMK